MLSDDARPLRVVHLPVYHNNAYQPSLLQELRGLGIDAIDGGGGGNFIGVMLRKWRPDVLHVHWTHPYMVRKGRLATVWRGSRFCVELLLLRLMGTRLVWTLHNWRSHDALHPRLENFFVTCFVRLMHVLVAHCDCAADEASERWGIDRQRRVCVIPHGSYVGVYPDEISREAARRELGLEMDDSVFLFLGGVKPYKGLGNLVRVVAGGLNGANASEREAVDEGVNPLARVRLVVAGQAKQDSDWDVLREACGRDGRVMFFPGYVADERLQVFLRAADVMVLPYRDVLTSGSVMLGMSFGLPIVAPRLGCVPEALGGENGGWLYDAADRAGLLRALVGAMGGRADWGAIGLSNRSRAEKWSWPKIAEEYAALYDRLVR